MKQKHSTKPSRATRKGISKEVMPTATDERKYSATTGVPEVTGGAHPVEQHAEVLINAMAHALERANERIEFLERVVATAGKEITESKAAIGIWRACGARDAKEIADLRKQWAEDRRERMRTSRLVGDLQLCMAQGADTVCGSRWMLTGGLAGALKRYSEEV